MANKATKKWIIIVGILLVTVLTISAVTVSNDRVKQNSSENQLSLGEKYLSELDYENAILCFERVIEVRPKNARAYLGLADAYYAKGDPSKAIEILKKAYKETKNPTVNDRLNEITLEEGADENNDISAIEDEGSSESSITNSEIVSSSEVSATASAFLDIKFEKILRIGLQKPTGEITETDLESIISFRLYRTGSHEMGVEGIQINDGEIIACDEALDSLEPITQLKNLKDLHIQHNNVSDLSVLSSLTNLTSLSLEDNQISDLSPVSGLTNLTSLVLNRNQISDISPLSKLTNINHLQLYSNQISDISTLSKLKKLQYLDLSHNPIDDISPLAELPQLNYLGMQGNQVSDWSPVENVENIPERDGPGGWDP